MPVFTLEQAFRLSIHQIHTGNRGKVEALYEQIRQNPPPYAEGLLLLGVMARELGRVNESVELMNQAVRLKPDLTNFSYQSGIVLAALGRVGEAIDAYRKAAPALPKNAQVRAELGALLHQSGCGDEAIGAYRDALVINPDDATTLSNLGHALKEKGELDESLAVLERAVSLRPDFAGAYNNLGNTYEQLNRPAEALAALRKAVELEPQLPEAHNNLGNALQRMSRFEEAVSEYSRAVELNANYPEALVNLGNAMKDSGQIPRAIDLYRRAVSLMPDAWPASNLLLVLYYDPSLTPQQILAEHREWGMCVSATVARFRMPHTNSREPDRRLRIGYVSGDFRHHVVGYNLIPLFENHDHANFEIFCYSTTLQNDDITARFRGWADHWLDARNLSDDQLGQRIRSDGIDILVDLSLHTAAHRLPVFARKPAPVQVTFAGYPGTTGLAEIDYRLTDPYLDPPGENDSLYAEKSFRLAHSWWCYQALSDEPAVNPLPAMTNKYVTFGSLTNFCKINDGVLALWARVMARIPNSRLLMVARPGSHRDRTRQIMQSNGIGPGRVEFVDYQPREKYLETYHRVDLGLDTFPYNGHTTSLDSYWMGVPVVTLVGEWAVGRAGFSQLTNLGLSELAAGTPDEFVRIATDLAKDISRLGELRRTLRGRMEASPLMNGKQFAKDIENAYREMWKAYVGADPRVRPV